MTPPKLARGRVCSPSQPTVCAAKWLCADQFAKADTMSAPPASTQRRSAASSWLGLGLGLGIALGLGLGIGQG